MIHLWINKTDFKRSLCLLHPTSENTPDSSRYLYILNVYIILIAWAPAVNLSKSSIIKPKNKKWIKKKNYFLRNKVKMYRKKIIIFTKVKNIKKNVCLINNKEVKIFKIIFEVQGGKYCVENHKYLLKVSTVAYLLSVASVISLKCLLSQ